MERSIWGEDVTCAAVCWLQPRERSQQPNLQSIYREAMLYLKKRDWDMAKHLADKAIEKLESGDRRDLAGRVRTERDSRANVRDYYAAMEKYGGGGC